MIHVQPLGLQYSEAMCVHARLVKFNLSILHVRNCLAPVVCERRVYHTQSSRGVSTRRTVAMVHTQGEHYTLKFSEGIILECYRRTKQNKMHKR